MSKIPKDQEIKCRLTYEGFGGQWMPLVCKGFGDKPKKFRRMSIDGTKNPFSLKLLKDGKVNFRTRDVVTTFDFLGGYSILSNRKPNNLISSVDKNRTQVLHPDEVIQLIEFNFDKHREKLKHPGIIEDLRNNAKNFKEIQGYPPPALYMNYAVTFPDGSIEIEEDFFPIECGDVYKKGSCNVELVIKNKKPFDCSRNRAKKSISCKVK